MIKTKEYVSEFNKTGEKHAYVTVRVEIDIDVFLNKYKEEITKKELDEAFLQTMENYAGSNDGSELLANIENYTLIQ